LADDESKRGPPCPLTADRDAPSGRLLAAEQTGLLETQRLGVGLAQSGRLPGARAALGLEGLPGLRPDLADVCALDWARIEAFDAADSEPLCAAKSGPIALKPRAISGELVAKSLLDQGRVAHKALRSQQFSDLTLELAINGDPFDLGCRGL
jgi:hypothetical protein